MPKWKFSYHVTMVFLFIFRTLCGEVSLRVLLQPPMVTLECLISNPVEKASVIMMCPNDVMCFQSCSRLCDKDCTQNNITCMETKFSNGMKYTYLFDTSNTFNQGEWTCHFGTQQSSTVIFFNETTGKMPQNINDEKVLKPVNIPNQVPVSNSLTSMLPIQKRVEDKEKPMIDPIYVIILLMAFAISLCINIFLVIRSICYKCSRKDIFISNSLKKKSCFRKFCIKLFCAEKYFKFRDDFVTKYPREGNPQLSRQNSNNVYEFSPHMQPAIVVDNKACILTPHNSRMPSQNMYERSFSFPAKSVYQQMNGKVGESKLLTNPIGRPHFTQMISPQESVSQIIYDDVAESTNNYMPSNNFTSLSRPTKYNSFSGTYNNRLSNVTLSMNNLPPVLQKLPSLIPNSKDCNMDVSLKDEISSRVELSKEMLTQADTLLRKAGTLLNDKEEKTTSHN